MIKWLSECNIPCSAVMLKPELYEVIKSRTLIYKTYKIDAVLAVYGPLYHPDMNPIEIIWATVKDHVKKKNVHFLVESVTNLASEQVAAFSAILSKI